MTTILDALLTVHLILFFVSFAVLIVCWAVLGAVLLKWKYDSNTDSNGVRSLKTKRYMNDIKFLAKITSVLIVTSIVHIWIRP